MTTKHTPGPWHAATDEIYGHPARLTPNILIQPVILGRPVNVSLAKVNRGGYESLANARLIAAAPELLEGQIESASAIEDAYEVIYQSLPDGPVPDWFVRLERAAKQARAAIAKAGDAQ